MTRGNQRDLARAKNLKKQQEQAKGKPKDGSSVQSRMEKDAAAMRAKQDKALAKKAEEDAAKGAGGSKIAKVDPLNL